jgi:hypothetical protein
MFWFYHEYCDEAGRFRIHRIESQSEAEARRMHRNACEFRWVTEHVRPSVSSLFTRGDYGPRTLAPAHHPGQPYRTEVVPVPMPDDIRQRIAAFRLGA